MFPPAQAPIGPGVDPTVTQGSYLGQNPPVQPGEWHPSAEQQQKIGEIVGKRNLWRRIRQPHEQQWFINTGIMRGQHNIEYNVRNATLVVNPPLTRERHAINRTRAKVVGRRSKFLKGRTKVFVVSATGDSQDRLNARATRMAIDYVWRKQKVESKRRRAVMMAEVAAKGFVWLHWDEHIQGDVMIPDELTGQPTRQRAVLGDVVVEVGSPYEILVADPTIPSLGEQPEIMRIKLRRVEDLKQKYPDFAEQIRGTAGEEDLFRFEKQIASLNATGYGSGFTDMKRGADTSKDAQYALVTEHFVRTCPKYPEGEYRVLINDGLLVKEEALPYGFSDMDNPYPVVEFTDIPNPNQFWGTTLVEQLLPIQREYNSGREKLAEFIKHGVHPKIIVFKQHRMPPNAWHNGPGEIIELMHMPGLPQPIIVQPPNLAGDLWRALDTFRSEFDDVSQIYPVSEGRAGSSTSGFMTNLLQESGDSIHRPDVDSHLDALEELVLKIRRLIKLGYSVPRLVTTIGRNMQPDAIEFVNSQVDEAADIKVEIGTGLPDLRAQRLQMLKEMHDGGLFGPPGTPDASRKFFSLAELGGPDEAIDSSRLDENQAHIENNEFSNGGQIANPEFFDNHQIHLEVHTDLLKSAEARQWPPEQKQAMLLHCIGHLDYINPQAAMDAAMRYGLPLPPGAMAFQQQQAQQQAQAAASGKAPAAPAQQPPPQPAPSPGPAPAPPAQ
jgi:hypothetical protein